MVQIRAKLITEQELIALGSDARIEVVDGEIVEMPPVGMMHAFVVNNVYNALNAFVSQHRLGYVFSDGLIYILSTEGQGLQGARVPDVSFIRKGHIPPDFDLRRPFPGTPDLAIEVVSPGDNADDLLAKVREYLSAGSEQVWVLYPEQKEVHQYARGADTARLYTGEEQIDAEVLFPGIALVVSAFFELPDLDS